MMPVALGSGEGGDFRAPLGIAVIGGVVTSTLLTLLVIPTVYEIAGRHARLARGASIRSSEKRHHEPGHASARDDRPHGGQLDRSPTPKDKRSLEAGNW